MMTPWGESDSEVKVAEGITSIDTPRHGGYFLDSIRQDELLKKFPGFLTFAGGSWYEEDQDWAAVALAFPDHHSIDALRGAVQTVVGSAQGGTGLDARRWHSIRDWLDESDEGRAIVARVKRYEDEISEKWEIGATSCPVDGYPPKSCSVHLHRVGDRETQEVVFSSYPDQRHYTDDELKTHAAAPLDSRVDSAEYVQRNG